MKYNRHLIKDFEQSRRDHPNRPVLLSEGDSWLSYSNIIGRLDEVGNSQRAWSLLRLENAGDEILTIMSGAQRSKLRGYLSRWQLDAMLFSGGGNDIIGPDLLPLLRRFEDGMGAEDLVSFSRFERRLRQIQDCYRELLDMLSDAEQEAKVFVNSYDYAVPSDRSVKLFGIVNVTGPWMLPAFADRGIPEELHRDVIRLLVDGFCAAVDAVAAESRGAGRLFRVETRETLGAGDWKDEIHPNNAGARKIADKFRTTLANAGII